MRPQVAEKKRPPCQRMLALARKGCKYAGGRQTAENIVKNWQKDLSHDMKLSQSIRLTYYTTFELMLEAIGALV